MPLASFLENNLGHLRIFFFFRTHAFVLDLRRSLIKLPSPLVLEYSQDENTCIKRMQFAIGGLLNFVILVHCLYFRTKVCIS